MTTMSLGQEPIPFQPQPRHRLHGWLMGRTRIATAWIFAALLVLTARDLPHWPGVLVCFLGASLRYWASGYLRKDSRPAVGGPYAHIRNPLYLGTYLMAVGTALSTRNLWLLGTLSVVFAAIYHFIITDEETKLREIFGAPYLRYCQLVPRFWPRLTAPLGAPRVALLEVNPELEHHHFSKELASRNRAHEAYLTFVALIGFVALSALFWAALGPNYQVTGAIERLSHFLTAR